MTRQLSRRTMLRGLGASLALPLFDAMLPRAVRAGSAAMPKSPVRLAFFFVPNGIHMADWTPQTEGTAFELPPILQPLAGFRNDLTVLTGLAQNQAAALGDGPGDHARSAAVFLTGVHPRKTHGANISAGTSVDQIAAQRIGYQTMFPSLELGCHPGRQAGNCDSGYSCVYSSTISWRSASQPLTKETQPRLVFERLFGSGDADGTGRSRYERQKYQRSILDYVRDDATRLNKQLGVTDAHKLDEYLTAVREVEHRLSHAEKLAKQGPPAADVGTANDYEYEGYAEQIRLMGDLMVLAFQCDMTRVVTFMIANEGSNNPYPMIGVKEGHHGLSHHGRDPEKLAKISKINQFHTEQLAYIAGRLKQVTEGNDSLLDNLLLVYGSGIGDGDRHNHDDLPVLMLGHGGGQVATGRHLVYSKSTPMNNLYLSMLDCVGAPVDTLGDSTGRLAGLRG